MQYTEAIYPVSMDSTKSRIPWNPWILWAPWFHKPIGSHGTPWRLNGEIRRNIVKTTTEFGKHFISGVSAPLPKLNEQSQKQIPKWPPGATNKWSPAKRSNNNHPSGSNVGRAAKNCTVRRGGGGRTRYQQIQNLCPDALNNTKQNY